MNPKHIIPLSFSLSSFDQAGAFLALVLRTSKAIRLIKSPPSPAERTRSVQTHFDPLNDQWSLLESPHWLLLEGQKDEWRERKLQKRWLDSENVREIMTGRQKKRREKKHESRGLVFIIPPVHLSDQPPNDPIFYSFAIYLFKSLWLLHLLIPRRANSLLWLLVVSATNPNSSLDTEDYKGHSMMD